MELKQRIIGIIVLIALGLILVPLIFDSEPVKQPSEQLSENAPPPAPAPTSKQASNTVIKPEPIAKTVTKVENQPAVAEEEEINEVSKPDPISPSEDADVIDDVKESDLHAPVVEAVVHKKPKAPVVTAHHVKPKPKLEAIEAAIAEEEVATTTTSTSGWAVQLGVFSDRANANSLAKRLQKSGFHAFVKEDKTGKKKISRVFIGPEANKNVAEKTLKALEKKLQINGIVVRYQA